MIGYNAESTSMAKYFPIVLVATASIAVAGAVISYRLSHAGSVAQGYRMEIRAIDTKTEHVRGSNEAPVTLEEFGDFECPPCGALSKIVKELEKDCGSSLRVVFRHHPLEMHPHAMEAAIAAEAAGVQGRFWEMHDLLYAEQADWSKANNVPGVFVDYATRLQMDVEKFKRDVQSPEVKARVASDQARAALLNVRSTPTLFINNSPVPRPFYSRDRLRVAIDIVKPIPGETSRPAN
jgi:protein-disulfide isomerase